MVERVHKVHENLADSIRVNCETRDRQMGAVMVQPLLTGGGKRQACRHNSRNVPARVG